MKILFPFSCLVMLIRRTGKSRLEQSLHCSIVLYARMQWYQLFITKTVVFVKVHQYVTIVCLVLQGTGFSLSVYSPSQILKIGTSADYGVCNGKRKDGMSCTLVINKYVRGTPCISLYYGLK